MATILKFHDHSGTVLHASKRYLSISISSGVNGREKVSHFSFKNASFLCPSFHFLDRKEAFLGLH